MGEYEEIEKAVMETERGRWFLAEYAKRQRSADTQMLLEAIRKLEDAMRRSSPDIASSRRDPSPSSPPDSDFFAQDEDLFEEPPAPPKLVVPSPTESQPEKKRIVIIRRAAGEAIDIPLAKDAASG